MREVLSRAAAGDERAVLGRDVYLHRLRASVAAMTAAMDGLDVLVFTGGVGENSPEIRFRTAAGLGFLGVAVDEARNLLDKPARGGDDWQVIAPGARVRTFVIAAREDKQIAAEVRSLLPPRLLGAVTGRAACIRYKEASQSVLAWKGTIQFSVPVNLVTIHCLLFSFMPVTLRLIFRVLFW